MEYNFDNFHVGLRTCWGSICTHLEVYILRMTHSHKRYT